MTDPTPAIRTACRQSGNGLIAAYLFGSRAAGTEHAESDVDVGVLFDHAIVPGAADRARLAMKLGSELIGATHSNQVDVVVLNDAPPELSASVLTRGTRVFCSDPEADRAFQRRTISLAADQTPFLRRMRQIKLAALTR